MIALIGTIIGSYCGYLFNQAQPNGLGFIAMATTIGLGIKFLLKPIDGGIDHKTNRQQIHQKKIVLAMVCGLFIG